LSSVAILLGLTQCVCCDDGVDYQRHIKPILAKRCFACHGALKQESSLRLDTGSLIRKGGESGPAVVAGDIAQSLLIERISSPDETDRMPPEGEALTAEQIEVIRKWISAGAQSPENEQPEQDPREHWSFKKPVRHAVPRNSQGYAFDSPIDGFIAQVHARHGLAAQRPAAKHVLLRRVSLDLIGVPPTREELHDFLSDESPIAYERVVDRLLTDPRHGERWARHWMDVWRYSDWYGRRHVPDVWNSAPQIWRWRDWIVRSLNGDHGYDRMVREMLAADEVAPEDDEAGYATGYLIRNWYALNPNDWMRSTVEHTGKAFLGLTFNCAHCHDHKYDPIQQEDYFRLRAFFEPIAIRQDRVPGEADPGPFEKYQYSTLRKIQRLGAVRIFDETPDAPTWFYTGGDERNRVKERGSISPGVPAFLAESLDEIETVQLPPRAWYPGLNPAIQQTILADANTGISAADAAVLVAQKTSAEPSQAVRDELAQAEAAYEKAFHETEQAGRSGSLVGRQTLFFDATQGRRIIHNGLPQLKTLGDGTLLEFQLLIMSDAHVNFQFAKDIVKGLTAGFVAFEKGSIFSYEPGSTKEFAAGQYDFAAGETRFQISLLLQTEADRCLLTVRTLPDGKTLLDGVPVALNGWNPVGNPAMAITFDARTGSVAAVDEVIVTAPMAADSTRVPIARFDFEPPGYPNGHDVVGHGGWTASPFSVAPATSVVSATAANSALREFMQKRDAAREAARRPKLRLLAAEAKAVAARAELAGVEARIKADHAKYRQTSDADALARIASLLEREAALRLAEANILTQERSIAEAESLPAKDAQRTKKIDAAKKSLSAAQTALDKARTKLADESEAGKYTAFSPTYPRTSSGRRRALANWMTDRNNPLTARVAVNHIWMRHFHAPLVASVNDFGRNGDLPTHPELLDWLAVEFMDSQWSMKQLHCLIVTSGAYRRVSSSRDADRWIALDPENHLLWRMNTGRMEAEVLRDSLLYCAGKLDPTIGGQELENKESLATRRRSLYYSVYPEQGGKSPLGELFDGPDALDCYRRTRTIVPQQALALTNSDLVHAMSAAIVNDWGIAELGSTRNNPKANAPTEQFVIAVFERILSRTPTETELRICQEALEKHGELTTSDSAEAVTRARESVVRALLNHNDFVTIR
jgi:hypothetical protein